VGVGRVGASVPRVMISHPNPLPARPRLRGFRPRKKAIEIGTAGFDWGGTRGLTWRHELTSRVPQTMPGSLDSPLFAEMTLNNRQAWDRFHFAGIRFWTGAMGMGAMPEC
jgi:hypothetical protein